MRKQSSKNLHDMHKLSWSKDSRRTGKAWLAPGSCGPQPYSYAPDMAMNSCVFEPSTRQAFLLSVWYIFQRTLSWFELLMGFCNGLRWTSSTVSLGKKESQFICSKVDTTMKTKAAHFLDDQFASVVSNRSYASHPPSWMVLAIGLV